MRRLLAIFLATLGLTACGSQVPPERTPLPDAASLIPEPEECQFQIGPGQGVRIETIIADTGADGVLQVGDLLVSVNDQAITSANELRQVLADEEVGSTINVTVEREGDAVDEVIDLGPNPDDPARPMMGVTITTAFLEVAPADLEQVTINRGDFARPISVGGQLFAFDPLNAEWTSLAEETPADNWVASSGRVLYLEGPDQPGSALLDVANDEQLVFEIGDWNGSTILGTLGRKVVMAVTRPVPGNAQQLEIAVMLVDFDARNADWIWQVTADSGIPLASFPSPGGAQILLVGEDSTNGEYRHVLLSAEGARTGSVEVPEGYIALGWFDDQSLLVGRETEGLQIVDLGGADPVALELPAAISTLSRVWPVGDGSHVLGETGNALVRFSTDLEAEVRTLADNCQVDQLGDPGWSA